MRRAAGLILLAARAGLGAHALLAPPPPWHHGAFSASQRLVAATLRDPGSAEFRGLAKHAGDAAGDVMVVCGEVTARNALGGPAGFRRFIVGWERAGATGRAGAPPVEWQAEPRAFARAWARECSGPIVARGS